MSDVTVRYVDVGRAEYAPTAENAAKAKARAAMFLELLTSERRPESRKGVATPDPCDEAMRREVAANRARRRARGLMVPVGSIWSEVAGNWIFPSARDGEVSVPLWRAAHEGGHTSMAILFGFEVERVNVIEPNAFHGVGQAIIDFSSRRPIAGSLRVDACRAGSLVPSLEEQIALVFLAGGVGEQLVAGVSQPRALTPANYDFQQALAYIRKTIPAGSPLPPQHAQERLLALIDVAHRLLSTGRGSAMVKVVADALQRRGALNRDELDALLNGAS